MRLPHAPVHGADDPRNSADDGAGAPFVNACPESAGANPLPKQRLQAIFFPRIAMRVSRDWDSAVVAGVCPDDEKTGGATAFRALLFSY